MYIVKVKSICYNKCMNLKETLKELNLLKQQYQALEKEHEMTLHLLFEANEKLNLILKD